MRFFIALEIPESSRRQLEIVQNELEKIIPGIRLTNNEKLHITIAFIGEQPEEIRGKLALAIKEATFNITPFDLTPAYMDGFPDLHHAHTFWVGVSGDIDKLMVIRERIKDGLIHLGLDTDERRYIPHIAIAKTNSSFHLQSDQEVKLQQLMLDNFQPIQITSIKLFESIPEEGFHKHNTLAEIKLNS